MIDSAVATSCCDIAIRRTGGWSFRITEIAKGTLRKLVREAGLTVEEFSELV